MAKEVVISNSSLNDYGSRVLTAGIDVKQFERNPILLWMHNRPWRGTNDGVLPIGRIENLRVDGDNLIGTPVFDESDEFAKKIQAKWEGGFLKMVSAGLDVIEFSEDPIHLLQGQKRPTITKSKLREVSIVDMGANDDAIVLFHEGKQVNLAHGMENNEIGFLKLINKSTNESNSDMKTIALKLGLPETATESDILSAIAILLSAQEENVKLKADLEGQVNLAITAAVEGAISDRKITADKKDHFVKLGKAIGVASLSETFAMMAAQVKPTDITGAVAGSGKSDYKKLSDVPETELAKLHAEDRDTYVKLYKAEYGVEPEK